MRHSSLPVALCLALATSLIAADARAEVWAQGNLRIASPTPGSGSFGATVAVLDFDGDGDDDLAIADPGATDDGGFHPIVRIFVRTPSGWQSQFQADLAGKVQLGASLAVGDFDEDGRDDLLIGAPGMGSGGGAVYLLRHLNPSTLVMDAIINNGGPSGGRCGTSLAVADFDGDDHLDFATGCPAASFDTFDSVGRVHRAYGFGTGSFDLGFLHQGSAGVAGGPEPGDGFGYALAAGDFDGDSYDDLAVGVPGEDVDGGTDTGAVHILFGSPSGLSGAGSQLWHQGTVDVPGISGDGDAFGSALAAGDFDRATVALAFYDDLAIGIPDDAENLGGAVLVLRGSSSGLVTADAQVFTEASFATPSDPDNTHSLGVSLAAARLDRGFTEDLVIGIEGRDEPFFSTPGAACILYGSTTTGLTTAKTICFSASSGEIEAAGIGALFASALATGNLDDNAGRELVIGSPDGREVFVLKNALFADGFEIGGTSRWFDPND